MLNNWIFQKPTDAICIQIYFLKYVKRARKGQEFRMPINIFIECFSLKPLKLQGKVVGSAIKKCLKNTVSKIATKVLIYIRNVTLNRKRP